jgi:CSLREA domain-containing protein
VTPPRLPTAKLLEPQRGRPAHLRHLFMPVLALAALLCLLGGTTAATAAEYTVNSTGDQVDEALGSNGCKTAVDTCTLRAAIEESNASTGINDTIKFSAFFDGQVGDTIELGTSLPTVIDRVRIQGFPSPQPCETDYFDFEGPCVGVNGPAGGTAFRIAAERVILIGFAISDSKTAVEVVGAPGFEAWNDWFGIKLDGSTGGVETGISIDQGSNGADIGGASSVARNIFAHNSGVAVDIAGADATTVRGNGFGVLPDGNTLAANGTNIEITDMKTGENRVARANWIGGTLDDDQLASSVCDGACNLISGATESGIDLLGDDPDEEPARGGTRIFGNYIGLNAFGTTGLPNALQGVLVGSAENVTIGGPRPGDRNMLNGGAYAVLAGPNAGNLTSESNWIGLNPAGTAMLSPPTIAGIAIEDGYQLEIAANRISMSGGTAIEQGGQEAVIRFNAIGKGVDGGSLPGGSTGLYLFGSCFTCNLVYGNSISNAADYGVLIENGRNDVYGNRIEASGAAGIRIKNPVPFGIVGNLIGGDSADEENTISGSAAAAIEIVRSTPFSTNARNEVARNNGGLNGGPFIDLVDGGNGEILPPAFASSTPAGASGSGALAGATIRVFRKASSSPGELEGFLAETFADNAGNWNVVYPSPIASGTIVAATQTSLVDGTAEPKQADGTSELVFSVTTEEPEGGGNAGGGGDEGGAGGGASQPPSGDTTPPQTSILKRPKRISRTSSATFEFTSSEPGSRFQCRLDRRPVGKCRSPRTFARLRPGNHVFRAWAIDVSGNKDRTPARFKFRVVAPGSSDRRSALGS